MGCPPLARSRAQGMRSSSNFVRCLLSALFKNLDGGAEEDRTPDPLRARQVLSQLSYGPRLTRRQASPQDAPSGAQGRQNTFPPSVWDASWVKLGGSGWT